MPDHDATVLSAVERVPAVASVAPTVTTHGSSPGEVTEPAPSLPADVTTVMPDAHAASTAPESGFARYGRLTSAPNERFSTPMS